MKKTFRRPGGGLSRPVAGPLERSRQTLSRRGAGKTWGRGKGEKKRIVVKEWVRSSAAGPMRRIDADGNFDDGYLWWLKLKVL